MLFTTYGITYFWQNANYIRFDPFFDPGLYDQIRSDPVWSGCSIYKWIRPFRTFFNLITFLNCNFIKVAYRLGQTWTNCKYICFPRNRAKMNLQIDKGIPVLFQGSFGSTKRLMWWVFDVVFSITDYLFWIWVVRVGRSWLIYLQRESDLLIWVSYHTQTAFEKHERAPERLPWNRTGIPL